MYTESYSQTKHFDDGILLAETDDKACTLIARQKYLTYLKQLEEQEKQKPTD